MRISIVPLVLGVVSGLVGYDVDGDVGRVLLLLGAVLSLLAVVLILTEDWVERGKGQQGGL